MTSPHWLNFLCCVGLGFMLCSCNSQERQLSRSLASAIEQASQTEPALLVVTNGTDFAWDKMFIFGPYTPVATIQKSLGSPWVGARKSGVESDDSFCLLVFMHDGKVIQSVSFSRASGDFAGLSSTNALSPSEAVFNITRTPSGGIRVSPREGRVHIVTNNICR